MKLINHDTSTRKMKRKPTQEQLKAEHTIEERKDSEGVYFVVLFRGRTVHIDNTRFGAERAINGRSMIYGR